MNIAKQLAEFRKQTPNPIVQAQLQERKMPTLSITDPKFGLVYLNAGTGCLPRLLISVRSLRKHYQGNAAIYSIGEDSHKLCKPICAKYNLKLISVDWSVPKGNNRVLLEKILLLKKAPYEKTLYVDSDTIVLRPFEKETLEVVGKADFAVTCFSNWTAAQGIIRRRLKAWKEDTGRAYIKAIPPAFPALNTGVYYFTRNNPWVGLWYDLAMKGREGFISDEISMQMLLPTLPHVILPEKFNYSCRYGSKGYSLPGNTGDAIFWHFHGRKHCRKELNYGGAVWVDELAKAMEENDCGVKEWMPCEDRMLKRFLRYTKGKLPRLVEPSVTVQTPNPMRIPGAAPITFIPPTVIPKQESAILSPARPAQPPTVAPLSIFTPASPASPAKEPAPGIKMNTGDSRILRHCRDRYKGHRIGIELQPVPMLFTRDGHNVWLGDMYKGKPGFLICGGPSLKTHNLSLLNERGVLTYSLNNAVSVVRSHIWSCVDDPGHFVDCMWRDPGIMKLVPLDHMDKVFQVRDESGKLVMSKEKVGDMPNIFGFRRNENFLPEQFLYESTVNWGNHSEWKDQDGNTGARSIFLAALRLSFYLGIRRLYLLGCDFKMEVGKENYAFSQDRTPGSVKGNNYTYSVLNQRLTHLKPYMDAEGFEVYNCCPDSGLKVFPFKPYADAVAEATADIPKEINTVGMYESTAAKKKKQQQKMDEAKK